MEFSEIFIFRKKSPCPCFILFTKIKQKERLVYSVYRKQVMPFEKFQKENFNQKWAAPLDFQKFFLKNIQKNKMGCTPHSSKTSFCPPSPQGEGYHHCHKKTLIPGALQKRAKKQQRRARVRNKSQKRHPRARFKSELKNSNAGRASETSKTRSASISEGERTSST